MLCGWLQSFFLDLLDFPGTPGTPWTPWTPLDRWTPPIWMRLDPACTPLACLFLMPDPRLMRQQSQRGPYAPLCCVLSCCGHLQYTEEGTCRFPQNLPAPPMPWTLLCSCCGIRQQSHGKVVFAYVLKLGQFEVAGLEAL